AVRDLRDAWRHRKDRAHLVRYEDLVFRPRETLTDLLDYLELDSSGAAVDNLVGVAAGAFGPGADAAARMHRTSSDAVASVGRWRHDLDKSLQVACHETFHNILGEMGYPENGYVAQEHRVGSR